MTKLLNFEQLNYTIENCSNYVAKIRWIDVIRSLIVACFFLSIVGNVMGIISSKIMYSAIGLYVVMLLQLIVVRTLIDLALDLFVLVMKFFPNIGRNITHKRMIREYDLRKVEVITPLSLLFITIGIIILTAIS